MNNVLQTKLVQNHIDLTMEEMYEFTRIFKKIELLFSELNPSRNKLIKFDYLFHKIIRFIAVSPNLWPEPHLLKPTAEKYNEIWDKIKAHL